MSILPADAEERLVAYDEALGPYPFDKMDERFHIEIPRRVFWHEVDDSDVQRYPPAELKFHLADIVHVFLAHDSISEG